MPDYSKAKEVIAKANGSDSTSNMGERKSMTTFVGYFEPKEQPICRMCDGSGLTEVVSVRDASDGHTRDISYLHQTHLCFCCAGTGVPPAPDPADDYEGP